MTGLKSCFAPHINGMLLQMEKQGYKPNVYHFTLRDFDSFCAANYPGRTELDREISENWLIMRENESMKTFYRRASNLRCFGRYLDSVGQNAYIVPVNFARNPPKSEPYIFTDGEMSRIFEQIDKRPATIYQPYRNIILPVIFRLIYVCGLRPNEGRDLMAGDVNLKTGELLIRRTKLHKDRVVVMSDEMLALCRKYNKLRLKFGADNEYFFPSYDGGPFANRWLLREFKECWIKANGGNTEIPNATVYFLRHRFASACLNKWLDEKRDVYNMLIYLRAYMGHSNIADTLYYVHLLPENLAKSAGIDWTALKGIIPEVQFCED